jgi:L-rhamnose mutarotase
MKKKLMITLPEELFNFLEENFINKSALIEALIKQKYKKHTDICINNNLKNNEIEQEMREVLDEGTA